eukprot:6181654-Pleurochrysis_carterae.AAC.1
MTKLLRISAPRAQEAVRAHESAHVPRVHHQAGHALSHHARPPHAALFPRRVTDLVHAERIVRKPLLSRRGGAKGARPGRPGKHRSFTYPMLRRTCKRLGLTTIRETAAHCRQTLIGHTGTCGFGLIRAENVVLNLPAVYPASHTAQHRKEHERARSLAYLDVNSAEATA